MPCSVVAIASLTSRRIVAGASFIGLFLVSSITAGVLVGDVEHEPMGSAAALINVLGAAACTCGISSSWADVDRYDSPLKYVDYGGLYAVLAYSFVLAVGIIVLLRRYRWTER